MDQAYQKLGELLLAKELITQDQLEQALRLQSTSGLRLGETLVRHGFITEDAVAEALATQYGYDVVDPISVFPSPEALSLLSFGEAASQCLLPLRVDDDSISCLVADPLNVPITDELAAKYRKRLILFVAPDTKLKARIVEAYRGEFTHSSLSAVRLPERFTKLAPRYESNGLLWIDATDSLLDRPVSLVTVSLDSFEKDLHLKNVKACAKGAGANIAIVHDSFSFENSRITIFERLSGLQLSETLQTGKANSPAEAAQTVSVMAKAASDLNIANPNWICAENIWLQSGVAKVAPIFLGQSDYRCESEVEALGNLLWQCLLGRKDCKFEANSSAIGAIPSGMLLILQRCLSSSDDRFETPKDVHDALATFKWASEARPAALANQIDRDELLATLRLVQAPPKLTFWQRLFARNVA